ncbi:MAG TPA: hypothetical protein PK760_12145, partial [Flavobacteriales bacterium]|nr:hypothetical protein [Flavobacteriales bacterium]
MRRRRTERIPVLIAHHNVALREGLALMVEHLGPYEVIACVGDSDAVTTACRDGFSNGVALVSACLADMDGYALMAWMHGHRPCVRCIALMHEDGPTSVRHAIRAGAVGMLTDRVDIEAL